MKKRFTKLFLLLLSVLLCLSLSGCSLIIDTITGDMHGDLSTDDDGNLDYHGYKYIMAEEHFIVHPNAEDEVVELGWRSNFPFFPNMRYFAFEEDSPRYIFCDNIDNGSFVMGLYVREDIDIYNAKFVVDGTKLEISFNTAVTMVELDGFEVEYASYIPFDMYLKDDPRIRFDVNGPYKHNGNWYLKYGKEYYLVSDEFRELLIKHGIIKDNSEAL